MTKKDMKGKSKCKFDDPQNSSNLKSYTTGHSLFGLGSTTESQNRCRLSIKKRAASTTLDFEKISDTGLYKLSNTTPYTADSCISRLDFSHIQSGSVLDFGHSALHPPSVNISSNSCPSFRHDFLLSSDEFPVPISDDPYHCFFQQLGSVPTQGECSSASVLQDTIDEINGSSIVRLGDTVKTTGVSTLPDLLASITLDFQHSVVSERDATEQDSFVIDSKLHVQPRHEPSFHDTACDSNEGNATSRLFKKIKTNVPHSCATNRYVNQNESPPHPFAESGSKYHVIHGVISLYRDIGDCSRSCKHCEAKFWSGEGLKKAYATYQPLYNKCCLDGRVRLPGEQEPPSYIKELLQNRQFMKNIRAYNQMFSMTSFGAHVVESINNGRDPYVFKISGQIYHWIGRMCPTEGDLPRFLQLYIYNTENEVENRMRRFGGLTADGLSTEIVERLIQLLDEQNELVKLFRTAKNKCQTHPIPDFKEQNFLTGCFCHFWVLEMAI